MTDYGPEDAFVAICHGLASQIAPELRIIDITDEAIKVTITATAPGGKRPRW
jgi:S-adenosylmethionine hydrolase